MYDGIKKIYSGIYHIFKLYLLSNRSYRDVFHMDYNSILGFHVKILL